MSLERRMDRRRRQAQARQAARLARATDGALPHLPAPRALQLIEVIDVLPDFSLMGERLPIAGNFVVKGQNSNAEQYGPLLPSSEGADTINFRYLEMLRGL